MTMETDVYPSGRYQGRLVCDGEGNLLASEGDFEGFPVAWDEENDQYTFVQPGEPSHNERHHRQFAGVIATQHEDPEAPGYAGSRDEPTAGNEHHWGVLRDDPHFKEGATDRNGNLTNTKVKQLPDRVAAKITGHTEARRV